MKLARELIDFAFAPRAVCMGCQSVRGVDENWVCSGCADKLKPLRLGLGDGYCARCGLPIRGFSCQECADGLSDIFMARAVYIYDHPADALVRAFKYRGAYRMAAWMGGEMAKLAVKAGMTDADIIVPVPMYILRKLRRGYDQADKLARAMSNALGIEYAHALTRVKPTRSQSKLSGEARRRNLVNAFRADKRAAGKRVLLVDDVRTTGTTALKCAQSLKSAGAKRVTLITFAVAEPGRGAQI